MTGSEGSWAWSRWLIGMRLVASCPHQPLIASVSTRRPASVVIVDILEYGVVFPYKPAYFSLVVLQTIHLLSSVIFSTCPTLRFMLCLISSDRSWRNNICVVFLYSQIISVSDMVNWRLGNERGSTYAHLLDRTLCDGSTIRRLNWSGIEWGSRAECSCFKAPNCWKQKRKDEEAQLSIDTIEGKH